MSPPWTDTQRGCARSLLPPAPGGEHDLASGSTKALLLLKAAPCGRGAGSVARPHEPLRFGSLPSVSVLTLVLGLADVLASASALLTPPCWQLQSALCRMRAPAGGPSGPGIATVGPAPDRPHGHAAVCATLCLMSHRKSGKAANMDPRKSRKPCRPGPMPGGGSACRSPRPPTHRARRGRGR